MSAYAGIRQDVHFGNKRQREPEVCSRENNGLLSELGRKHLLGSGVGKGYKVRDVKNQAAASLSYWLVGPGCHRRPLHFSLGDLSKYPGATFPGPIPLHPSIYPASFRLPAPE